jgi:hypothetical protein
MEQRRPAMFHLFGKLWRRLRAHVVDEVPDDLALCEFDCRRPQCAEAEWETCERRLRGAAGTLNPAGDRRAPRAPEPKAARR